MVLLLSTRLWAALPSEVAEPSSNLGNQSGFSNLGTNMVGTSAKELSCLNTKADPKSKKNAEKTATALETALKKIKFPAQTFSRTALLHFLSQVIYESANLTTTEQKGVTDLKMKGWGLIQVTGEANLKSCSACMNECSPPAGTKMIAGPLESIIGNKAPDRVDAALVSLCWWKKNITENKANAKIANDDSDKASHSVTQIVNAGGVGKEVTDGKKNLNAREKLFKALKSADSGGSCRQI